MREPESIVLNVPSAETMRDLGGRLARALLASDAQSLCVALDGDLGAGKTTLVGGLLAAAGIAGPVRSPTYTLIEPYEVGARPLYHMDLYRLADPGELEPLGVRDMLSDGAILLIEWPSKAGARLPPLDLTVAISYGDGPEDRSVRLTGSSPEGIRVLERFLL